MDEDSDTSVQAAVIERLDYLDNLAINGDRASRAALATTEISRLTGAWRSLLEQHVANGHGRCPQCSGWRLWRRNQCRIWLMAHEHLVSETRGSALPSRSMVATKLFSSSRPATTEARKDSATRERSLA